MARLACADLPALALQLLLRAHPDWKTLPVAVVDTDEPTGTLLWLNQKAWRARLRPGMRYASALSLDGRLRAGTVTRSGIDAAVDAITEVLRLHTPHVEPSCEERGVFWLDAGGLESLYTSVDAWARVVTRSLVAAGYDVHLACGFTRFGTYALARTPRSRVLVCQSEEEERRLARGVSLERLGIDPKLRDVLARLGVRTIGSFADLPAEGIRRRFGNDAWLLHRRARGEAWDPLTPLAAEEPLERTLLLEDPVSDSGILLFLVRRLVAALVQPLAAREHGVAALTVSLHRSLRRDSPPVVLAVRAAEPTLDEAVLADLVRLRLESEVRRELAGSSIVEIEVHADAAPAGREQLRLFHERTHRDLAAGSRALARVRAEFGEHSVVRAVLRQGHLPEAGFTWEALEKLVAPSPRVVLRKPLVRRIEQRPLALPPKPFRERDDCWIASPASGEWRGFRKKSAEGIAGDDVRSRDSTDSPAAGANAANYDAADAAARRKAVLKRSYAVERNPPAMVRESSAMQRGTSHGRVENMAGPYIVSGGWWNRELHREYHYASTETGEILWVYYDRQRRRWFLAGKVE